MHVCVALRVSARQHTLTRRPDGHLVFEDTGRREVHQGNNVTGPERKAAHGGEIKRRAQRGPGHLWGAEARAEDPCDERGGKAVLFEFAVVRVVDVNRLAAAIGNYGADTIELGVDGEMASPAVDPRKMAVLAHRQSGTPSKEDHLRVPGPARSTVWG